MAITLLEVAAATSADTLSTTTVVGNTGSFPLGTGPFDEGDTITEPFANAGAATLGVGDEVRITTTPAQFVADGVITAIGTPGANTNITFRIDDVITARTSTSITNLNLNAITGRTITNVTTTVPSGTSGIVYAVYEGDRVATSDLSVTFGTSGSTTTYNLNTLNALPEGAVITNSNVSLFNVLIES